MSGDNLKTDTEQQIKPSHGYGGDVVPEDAWAILQESPDAVLVDCRTQPEWVFVGVPDLQSVGKESLLIQWQVFPTMQVNSKFVDQAKAGGAQVDRPVLLLCRSGARSQAAAKQLTSAGFERAYNVAFGFEGGHDKNKHRGQNEGWKASGLPWKQD